MIDGFCEKENRKVDEILCLEKLSNLVKLFPSDVKTIVTSPWLDSQLLNILENSLNSAKRLIFVKP